MTISNQLPQPVYAGTAITAQVEFYDGLPPQLGGSGVLTDPSTIVLKFLNAGTETVWTYGGTGSIVRSSTGVYSAPINTSGMNGPLTIEWIGEGNVAVVNVQSVNIVTPPL